MFPSKLLNIEFNIGKRLFISFDNKNQEYKCQMNQWGWLKPCFNQPQYHLCIQKASKHKTTLRSNQNESVVTTINNYSINPNQET